MGVRLRKVLKWGQDALKNSELRLGPRASSAESMESGTKPRLGALAPTKETPACPVDLKGKQKGLSGHG